MTKNNEQEVGVEGLTAFSKTAETCSFFGGKMETKICGNCEERKSLLEFYKCKSGINSKYGYYSSFCKICNRLARNNRDKKNPWVATYRHIRARCDYNKNHHYYGRVKNCITEGDVKALWFRDKAYLLKQPSIDRIDNDKDYTLENCRYIELKENQSMGGKLGGRGNKKYN